MSAFRGHHDESEVETIFLLLFTCFFPQLSGKDQDIKYLPFISNGVVLCVPNHWSLILSFMVILRFIDLGCLQTIVRIVASLLLRREKGEGGNGMVRINA